jgi:cyclase
MSLKNPYKPGGMFEGASHLIFKNAKNLRAEMTAAEMNLWMHLRKGINGFKFRRQHSIGIYIADFYCHKVKLIIEADGSIHDKEEVKKADEERQKELERWGYVVIRFSNKQIMENLEKVIKSITERVIELSNTILNK